MTRDQALKLLSLTSSSTAKEQRAAWKSAVKRHHPDRGGDADMLRLVNDAYETLKGAVASSSSSSATSHTTGRPTFSNILEHENILYSAYAGTSYEVERLTRKWMARARKDNFFAALLGLPYKSVPSSARIWIHILEGVSLDENTIIHYHFKTKPMPGLNIIALPQVRTKPGGSRTILHSEDEGPSTRMHLSETEAAHFKENGMKVSRDASQPRIWFGEQAPEPLLLNTKIRYGMFKNIPLRQEHDAFLHNIRYGRRHKRWHPFLKVVHFCLSFYWIVLKEIFRTIHESGRHLLQAANKLPTFWRTLKRRMKGTTK